MNVANIFVIMTLQNPYRVTKVFLVITITRQTISVFWRVFCQYVSHTYFNALHTKALNWESSLRLSGVWVLRISSIALRRVYNKTNTVNKLTTVS